MVSLFDWYIAFIYVYLDYFWSITSAFDDVCWLFRGWTCPYPMNELSISIFRCASISRRALRRSRINGFSNHIICHFSLAWLGIKEPTRPKITATLHARVWRPCFKMFQDGSNTCWNQWSMEELAAGKGEEDEEGEGDQEGQFGHPPPTHQFYI